MHLKDHEITALFFERSEQAIDELMKRYGKSARNVAANILKNPLDAEECINEACLQMWNTIPTARPRYLGAYFCTVTRNVCLNRYHANASEKRNSHYDTALEELENSVSALCNVETEADARRLTVYLNEFLLRLDTESRYLFVHRCWHGDSVSAIAEQIGKTPHAVSVRLYRIRHKLQKYLQKEGFDI